MTAMLLTLLSVTDITDDSNVTLLMTMSFMLLMTMLLTSMLHYWWQQCHITDDSVTYITDDSNVTYIIDDNINDITGNNKVPW